MERQNVAPCYSHTNLSRIRRIPQLIVTTTRDVSL